MSKIKPEKELKGGKVNYYLVRVENPQREDQPAYQAECEDIIRALNMTFDEGCAFKAIWRSASARLGNGKPGHNALYDAQKVYHYGSAMVRGLSFSKPLAPVERKGLPDLSVYAQLNQMKEVAQNDFGGNEYNSLRSSYQKREAE